MDCGGRQASPEVIPRAAHVLLIGIDLTVLAENT